MLGIILRKNKNEDTQSHEDREVRSIGDKSVKRQRFWAGGGSAAETGERRKYLDVIVVVTCIFRKQGKAFQGCDKADESTFSYTA